MRFTASICVALLPLLPLIVQADGDAEAGKWHYGACAACHGPAAEGNVALHSPRPAGTDDWYLLAQLESFREMRYTRCASTSWLQRPGV